METIFEFKDLNKKGGVVDLSQYKVLLLILCFPCD